MERNEFNEERPEFSPGLLTEEEWEKAIAYYDMKSDYLRDHIEKEGVIDKIKDLNLWFLQFIEPLPIYKPEQERWAQRETHKRTNFRSYHCDKVIARVLGNSLKDYVLEGWLEAHEKTTNDILKNKVTMVKIKIKSKKV